MVKRVHIVVLTFVAAGLGTIGAPAGLAPSSAEPGGIFVDCGRAPFGRPSPLRDPACASSCAPFDMLSTVTLAAAALLLLFAVGLLFTTGKGPAHRETPNSAVPVGVLRAASGCARVTSARGHDVEEHPHRCRGRVGGEGFKHRDEERIELQTLERLVVDDHHPRSVCASVRVTTPRAGSFACGLLADRTGCRVHPPRNRGWRRWGSNARRLDD